MFCVSGHSGTLCLLVFFWEKSTALSLTQNSNVRSTQGLISSTLVSACLRTHVFVATWQTFRHGGESKKKGEGNFALSGKKCNYQSKPTLLLVVSLQRVDVQQ